MTYSEFLSEYPYLSRIARALLIFGGVLQVVPLLVYFERKICAWIQDRVGPNGVGKSTLAKNIAYHAVMQGHTAVCVAAAQMLGDLAAQDGDNALRRRLKYYAQPQVLLIDEVGYLSYGHRHADLLFEIVSRRYEAKSTIITTNRPFAEWAEVFPNAACVVSLVDRLIHHSEIIVIEGESYRMKEAKERASKKKEVANKQRAKKSNRANKKTT